MKTMKTLERPKHDISYDCRVVEFKGRTYYCTEDAWYHTYDNGEYWWGALAIDEAGDEYVIQWAFDSDTRDRARLPWDHVFDVEAI